ncbi:hypothetical protein EJB05_07533 [Eragrostis curvula]|uniref:Glucosidase II subunit alpha n=1 Tax=Eragrostis curvula TaxID=38414 RepID=A0A5J9WJ76_9POAL|nr:hypothetical protein EJB05_07533 [Eragrostis curvula]
MDPPPRRLAALLLFLLLAAAYPAARAWKKDEFRNCNQTPFCKRARARAPHSLDAPLSLAAGSLSVGPDGSVSAELSHPSRPRPLVLRLSALPPHALRLQIDEDYSTSPPPHRRFQVPDVLLPDVEARTLYLPKPKTSGGVSTVALSSDLEVVVKHDPFELTVRRAGSGDPVLSFNSHGLFDFEPLQASKPEGETWEEQFRSHTDTRPRGPQSITFDVSFHGTDFVYGLPEHGSTSLALRPTRGRGVEESEPYRLFNLDVFEYLHDSPFGLYGSIPFMIGHGAGAWSGFFWLNAAEMQIDVLAPGWDDAAAPKNGRIDTLWMAEAGVVDAFFFVGSEPKDVIKQYISVTGTPSMPQQFAVAYHQCRWNYRDEADVDGVDAGFDEHDIPYDVLWLDIEHTDGKRYFTWDRSTFPNPEQMQRKIADKGRKMVTIVDPHIKRDSSFHLHQEATEKGYYVKDATGNDYDGWCWPGASSYPDMLNPEIREWWADKFSYENYKGSTPTLYIWNDMNEPSVFNGPEVTMPRDALHYGDVEHRELHNAYGYYFHMATADGLVKRGQGNDRPFVLSRAFFAGSQRYGAVWTGDNSADWDHLKSSIPMVLTLGLTGISFSGADVGGFFGNPEPDLLVRWYQVGAFYPFFRGHAHHDTKRREPWLFGEASVNGIPVMRPLWLEFPDDKETYNNGEAFMVGPSLLAQGIYEEGQKSVSVYLPGKESWYDLRNGSPFKGGVSHKLQVLEESIPSFQRGGTIVPRKDRFRRSSTQMVNDPYTLVIALNSSSAAEGELYVDDGKSYDYQQGAFIHRRFVFADNKLTSFNIAPGNLGKKKFTTEGVVERIIILGLSSGAKKAIIEPENQEVDIELGPVSLRSGSSSVAPTIRRPNVRIADDWSIKIA